MAFVFLELKSTSFLETESFQLWSQESTLLPLSCKKQELKRQVREPGVVFRVLVSIEEPKFIYTCY